MAEHKKAASLRVAPFLIVLLLMPVWCLAQKIVDWDKIPWARKDFFQAERDPKLKGLLTEVEAYHLTNDVLSYLSRGMYDEIRMECHYILGIFPNHPRGLLLLTSMAKVTKRYTLPIPYFEKALSLYPQYALTHAQYGEYLSSIDFVDKGIEQLKEALRLDPNLPEAHAWFAEALARKGDRELALKASERAKELGYKGEIQLDPPKAKP